ncbi:hypothetical protein [Aromatoleum evansii]|uniref:hypothetical protein n=1 Tax=Aromatoleum evansii TaxID=59406 RepID=UPI00145F79C3|nr:hypothetical protein [Aromatoleum evansii]NMG31960.1 hypothetical protein [Aromatoleum evansii]
MKTYVRATLAATFTLHAVLAAAQTTKEEVDAAKLRAELAAELLKEATSNAQRATADSKSQTEAAKADFELAKMKAELLKSLIPDPQKYKVADPKAPKLQGSYNRLAYGDAEAIATKIVSSLNPAVLCKDSAILYMDEASVRTLLSVSRGALSSLGQLAEKLQEVRQDLDTQSADAVKPPSGGLTAESAGIAGGLLVAQFAMSLATSLKPVYAFESSSVVPVVEGALRGLVLSKMTGCTILEPASMVYTDASRAAPEEQAAQNARTRIKELRSSIRDAQARVATIKGGAKYSEDKLAQARVAQVEAVIKRVSEAADEAEKGLAELYVADAVGITPMDNAVRGGMLAGRIAGKTVYSLALKAIASDMDMIAEDGLFKSLRLSVSSGTVARWQLTDSSGVVRSIGAVSAEQPQTNIPVQISRP